MRGSNFIVMAVKVFMTALGFALTPVFFARQIFFAVDDHINFRRTDAAAIYTRDLEPRSDVERSDGFLQQPERASGVQQRAQKHVAADAGKTIEVGNAHKTFVAPLLTI